MYIFYYYTCIKVGVAWMNVIFYEYVDAYKASVGDFKYPQSSRVGNSEWSRRVFAFAAPLSPFARKRPRLIQS